MEFMMKNMDKNNELHAGATITKFRCILIGSEIMFRLTTISANK